jgi:hypothetical protein
LIAVAARDESGVCPQCFRQHVVRHRHSSNRLEHECSPLLDEERGEELRQRVDEARIEGARRGLPLWTRKDPAEALAVLLPDAGKPLERRPVVISVLAERLVELLRVEHCKRAGPEFVGGKGVIGSRLGG